MINIGNLIIVLKMFASTRKFVVLLKILEMCFKYVSATPSHKMSPVLCSLFNNLKDAGKMA